MAPVVVAVGPVGAGKSCLLFRYQYQRFSSLASGIAGCASYTVISEPCNKVPSLTYDLYDTTNMLRKRLQRAAVVLLVYDITSKASFLQVQTKWVNMVKEAAPTARIFLVGTKQDLLFDRKVPQHCAKMFADKNNFHFYESSAVTGQEVDRLFKDIAWTLHHMMQCDKLPTDNDSPARSDNQSLLERIKSVLPRLDFIARLRQFLNLPEDL